MKTLDDLALSPFSTYAWDDSRESLDGAPTDLPAEEDVAEVIACGDSGGGRYSEGYSAAVLRLRDGRFMGWSTWWGPTGDGFCYDAYGGDAVVYFSTTLEAMIWRGLDAEGRRLCGYPEERPPATVDNWWATTDPPPPPRAP